ncbi:MAG: hypothetical protein DWQ39_02740 [Bacteroidetes bacterium]|nr:MAG: hypothetical protein DWQ33_02825 [Bacteroidota bacterium]REK06417.1 MAG: hypothetical protein DWQ39_02740 [Bacteroidota bacterium]
MNQGILLPAFGKRGYYFAAYNLAFSIKHFNKDIPIAILHGNKLKKELHLPHMHTVFDHLIELPQEVMMMGGRMNPAAVKLWASDYSPFECTIQLDVDALAMQDLSSIFDELQSAGGSFYSHVLDHHKIGSGDDISFMKWASESIIQQKYNLPEGAMLPGTNSSFLYYKNDETGRKIFQRARENFLDPIPLQQLQMQWGGSQPDELYLNIALAQEGVNAKTEKDYLFLADKISNQSLSWIKDNYPLLCLYGPGNRPRLMYLEWYDRMLHSMHSAKKLNHVFKHHTILSDKYANAPSTPKQVKQNIAPVQPVIAEPVAKRPEKIRLHVPFFEGNDALRKAEILTCLHENLKCEQIERIFLYSEHDFSDKVLSLHEMGSGKLSLIRFSNRPTYRSIIESINSNKPAKFDISIIANADIFFQDTYLNMIKDVNFDSRALALSRWDLKSADISGADHNAKHFSYEYSQDTWIFKGKIPAMDCDFPFGIPACDNRMAYEMKRHFTRVDNPSIQIKTFHLHLSNERTYSQADRLPGNVSPIKPSHYAPIKKKRMLMIQKGKVGDVLLCLPIARAYADRYTVQWLLPKQYHCLFDYVDYVAPVERAQGKYDYTLDLSFGQGGKPEQWWRREKSGFRSFVDAKYHLAGIDVNEKNNLVYDRDYKKENALLEIIRQKIGAGEFALMHTQSDYGTPVKVKSAMAALEFSPIEGYTIFDWRKVIEQAAEIHCIDSSLCNFVDAIPEVRDIPKTYYPTDKVPNIWDRTILTNNWIIQEN